MIDIFFLCALFGAFILYSFIKGVEIGQKIQREQKIELKGPIRTINEMKDTHEYEKEIKEKQRIEEINAYNIDNYDGTGYGQKDFEK